MDDNKHDPEMAQNDALQVIQLQCLLDAKERENSLLRQQLCSKVDQQGYVLQLEAKVGELQHQVHLMQAGQALGDSWKAINPLPASNQFAATHPSFSPFSSQSASNYSTQSPPLSSPLDTTLTSTAINVSPHVFGLAESALQAVRQLHSLLAAAQQMPNSVLKDQVSVESLTGASPCYASQLPTQELAQEAIRKVQSVEGTEADARTKLQHVVKAETNQQDHKQKIAAQLQTAREQQHTVQAQHVREHDSVAGLQPTSDADSQEHDPVMRKAAVTTAEGDAATADAEAAAAPTMLLAAAVATAEVEAETTAASITAATAAEDSTSTLAALQAAETTTATPSEQRSTSLLIATATLAAPTVATALATITMPSPPVIAATTTSPSQPGAAAATSMLSTPEAAVATIPNSASTKNGPRPLHSTAAQQLQNSMAVCSKLQTKGEGTHDLIPEASGQEEQHGTTQKEGDRAWGATHVVEVNVSGRIFELAASTLLQVPDSRFHQLLAFNSPGAHDSVGRVFLPCDPEAFAAVVYMLQELQLLGSCSTAALDTLPPSKHWYFTQLILSLGLHPLLKHLSLPAGTTSQNRHTSQTAPTPLLSQGPSTHATWAQVDTEKEAHMVRDPHYADRLQESQQRDTTPQQRLLQHDDWRREGAHIQPTSNTDPQLPATVSQSMQGSMGPMPLHYLQSSMAVSHDTRFAPGTPFGGFLRESHLQFSAGEPTSGGCSKEKDSQYSTGGSPPGGYLRESDSQYEAGGYWNGGPTKQGPAGASFDFHRQQGGPAGSAAALSGMTSLMQQGTWTGSRMGLGDTRSPPGAQLGNMYELLRQLQGKP